MNEIGLRIKQLRKEKGLTQNDLSDGIVSRTYLSQIEKGTVIPSFETLEKLSIKLNCNVEEFYKTPSNSNFFQLNEAKKDIYSIEELLENNDYETAREKSENININLAGLSKIDLGVYFWAQGVINEQRDYKLACTFYQKSIEHLKGGLKPEYYIRTMNYYGKFLLNKGELPEAFNLLNTAYREILYNHINGIQKVFNFYNLGFGHIKIGEFFSAILFLEEAKVINEKSGLYYKAGDISLLLAACYRETSKWEEALKENFRSIKIYELQKNYNQIATIYHNIGNLYYDMKKYNDSFINFEISLDMFRKTDHRKGLLLAQVGKLKAMGKIKPYSECEEFFNMIVQGKTKEEIGLIFYTFSLVTECNNDLLKTLYYLEEALKKLEPNKYPEVLDDSLTRLIKLSLTLKEYAKTEEYFKKYLMIKKEKYIPNNIV